MEEITALLAHGDGGIGLNVYDYGGEGRPLLLSHATGMAGRVWDPVVRRLPAGFHVYTFDSRGHGDSDKPQSADAYAWEQYGRDLISLIKDLKIETPIFAAGHSAGAAHLVIAASQAPELFERLVLCDAIIGPKDFFEREPRIRAERARRRKSYFADFDEARDRLAFKPPMNTWSAETFRAYLQHAFEEMPEGGYTLKCPPEIEAWVYEGAPYGAVYDSIQDFPAQTLLVTGADSDVRFLVEAQHERFSRSELRIIDGATHCLPQERPNEFADLLGEWLLAART